MRKSIIKFKTISQILLQFIDRNLILAKKIYFASFEFFYTLAYAKRFSLLQKAVFI